MGAATREVAKEGSRVLRVSTNGKHKRWRGRENWRARRGETKQRNEQKQMIKNRKEGGKQQYNIMKTEKLGYKKKEMKGRGHHVRRETCDPRRQDGGGKRPNNLRRKKRLRALVPSASPRPLTTRPLSQHKLSATSALTSRP